MAVGMRGLGAARALFAARAGGAAVARLAAGGTVAAGATTCPAGAVGVAVPAGTGIDAIGHVPGAERGRILLARGALALATALPRLARTLRLERLVGLLGRGLAADGQAAMPALASAAAAAVVAHVVEAAQFAAFVGGVVAADVAGAAASADVHGRLDRLALADHRLQGQRARGAFLEAELPAQSLDAVGRELLGLPTQQRLRQLDAAVPDPLQAADLAALRFPQAADLAVAAFLEQHPEPVMRVGAADALDRVELRRAVLQRDAAHQPVDDPVGHRVLALGRAHAAHVLALDLVRGMHHRVGQLAVGGEQQQAGGVDVEAADRDPARALERRQRVEDGRAALGILARGDLALGLVVHQHPRRLGQRGGDEAAAVDLDAGAAGDAHAHRGDLAVDLDHAVGDALLQRAPRAEPGLRQHLVQPFLQLRLRRGGAIAALQGQPAAALVFLFTHLLLLAWCLRL